VCVRVCVSVRMCMCVCVHVFAQFCVFDMVIQMCDMTHVAMRFVDFLCVT